MAVVSLNANERTPDRKGGARRTRRAGLVPAILYGPGDDPKPLSLDAKEIEVLFRQYGGSVVWIDECGVQPRFRDLLQAIGPRARRIICTGTLERNRSYSQRCGIEELRAFDGPELAGVPALQAEDSPLVLET